ncbi:MAG: hypothetical protein FWG28_03240 [Clostridiales bacterium]|nr:hypothetical protein [Clostridiales bacterium]
MRDNYDFSGATRNPFAGKFKDGYNVMIHYNFQDDKPEGDKQDNSDDEVLDVQDERLLK